MTELTIVSDIDLRDPLLLGKLLSMSLSAENECPIAALSTVVSGLRRVRHTHPDPTARLHMPQSEDIGKVLSQIAVPSATMRSAA